MRRGELRIGTLLQPVGHRSRHLVVSIPLPVKLEERVTITLSRREGCGSLVDRVEETR